MWKKMIALERRSPLLFFGNGWCVIFLVLHMVVINKSLERVFFFQFLWCCSSGDKKYNKLAKSGYKQNMKIKGLRISIHVFGYLLELNIESSKFFKILNLVTRKPPEKMGWVPLVFPGVGRLIFFSLHNDFFHLCQINNK
jgi:hypothetical protein